MCLSHRTFVKILPTKAKSTKKRQLKNEPVLRFYLRQFFSESLDLLHIFPGFHLQMMMSRRKVFSYPGHLLRNEHMRFGRQWRRKEISKNVSV